MKKENFFSEARGREDRKGGSRERLSKPTSDDPNHPGEVGARSSAERGRLGWRQRLKNCGRDWKQSVECQQKLCCGWPGIITEEAGTSPHPAVMLAQVRAHL